MNKEIRIIQPITSINTSNHTRSNKEQKDNNKSFRDLLLSMKQTKNK